MTLSPRLSPKLTEVFRPYLKHHFVVPFCTPWLTSIPPSLSTTPSVPMSYSTDCSCPYNCLVMAPKALCAPSHITSGTGPFNHSQATSAAYRTSCAASNATPQRSRLPPTTAGSPVPAPAAFAPCPRGWAPPARPVRSRGAPGSLAAPALALTSPHSWRPQGPGEEHGAGLGSSCGSMSPPLPACFLLRVLGMPVCHYLNSAVELLGTGKKGHIVSSHMFRMGCHISAGKTGP